MAGECPHCLHCCLTYLHLFWELLTLQYAKIQPYQINYLSLASLSLNTWLKDGIPVWTWLNIWQSSPLIPESWKPPISFSLLPEDCPPFPLQFSPKHCQRDNSLFCGVAGIYWVTQWGDSHSQFNRSAMEQVWTWQRYDLRYPPSLFSSGHQHAGIFLEHLSDKTSKAVEIKQTITDQLKTENIQGWDREAGKKT